MLRDGLAAILQRRPWCLQQGCWPWRNWEPSAAQEAEWGDLNLLGVKKRRGDFPRIPKCLFSNSIRMGSPALQGGFKNSSLSFLERERDGRFSILSYLATARGAQTRQKTPNQLHFFYPRNYSIVQHECQDPGSFWSLHVFEVGVYLAWSVLTFWFLLLFSPIVAGELWPLRDYGGVAF